MRQRWIGVGSALGVLLFVFLLLSGCEQVIGLEDRVYSGGATVSPQCQAYCDTVLAACEGEYAVYSRKAFGPRRK